MSEVPGNSDAVTDAELRFAAARIDLLPEALFPAEVHRPRVFDLIGSDEIGAWAGVSRHRAWELPSLADFPESTAEPLIGPLWVRPATRCG